MPTLNQGPRPFAHISDNHQDLTFSTHAKSAASDFFITWVDLPMSHLTGKALGMWEPGIESNIQAIDNSATKMV